MIDADKFCPIYNGLCKTSCAFKTKENTCLLVETCKKIIGKRLLCEGGDNYGSKRNS